MELNIVKAGRQMIGKANGQMDKMIINYNSPGLLSGDLLVNPPYIHST